MCVVILRPLGKEDESQGWTGAKAMMSDVGFMRALQEYKKDDMKGAQAWLKHQRITWSCLVGGFKMFQVLFVVLKPLLRELTYDLLTLIPLIWVEATCFQIKRIKELLNKEKEVLLGGTRTASVEMGTWTKHHPGFLTGHIKWWSL